jgi:hypothetical protein
VPLWILHAKTAPSNNVLPAESPKKSHITRICIVHPAVHLGEPAADPNLAEALRRLIVQHLSGRDLEVISIAAISPIEITDEVKQKSCDYILFSTLTQKASSGRLGILKKAGLSPRWFREWEQLPASAELWRVLLERRQATQNSEISLRRKQKIHSSIG